MKVICSTTMPATPVATEGAKAATIRELITDRDGAPTFAMRLFEISPGGHTPRHSHNLEHEVFVLEGTGGVATPDGSAALKAGDAILIPPNEEHQFLNDGPATFRFLCIIPVNQACCR